MDERIDILDTHGNPIGRTAMKSEAHRNGWFHATTHIWLYTANTEILLQQRAKKKSTHPLLWDVSVAGHIGAGEDLLVAAIREIEEEIGLTVLPSDLHKIGCFKSVHRHADDLLDCEYHHTYICELKVPIDKLKKQDSEVHDLRLLPLLQFETELQDEALYKKYVPHGKTYYDFVVRSISKYLP
ncbi:NUDIX domain-containing protein [Cellulophaga sp. F20128]|uniref:NUDIX hydrolase n=1 Tax=Cellulophaga sp. F20128 TaxID=2926413 RepID=UPI001FF22EC5|nr:NUDIX domain-containing protein [Cellulophaga sp. F20128]MCK0158954.1 NUDIX domain-containing protein [Cellulophaga sp. F20128]